MYTKGKKSSFCQIAKEGRRGDVLFRQNKFGLQHSCLGKWSQNLVPIHKAMLPEISAVLSEWQVLVLFARRGSQVEQNRNAQNEADLPAPVAT